MATIFPSVKSSVALRSGAAQGTSGRTERSASATRPGKETSSPPACLPRQGTAACRHSTGISSMASSRQLLVLALNRLGHLKGPVGAAARVCGGTHTRVYAAQAGGQGPPPGSTATAQHVAAQRSMRALRNPNRRLRRTSALQEAFKHARLVDAGKQLAVADTHAVHSDGHLQATGQAGQRSAGASQVTAGCQSSDRVRQVALLSMGRSAGPPQYSGGRREG